MEKLYRYIVARSSRAYNKQFNRDKKLAGYSLRSILAHNFLPVNRALGFTMNQIRYLILILLLGVSMVSESESEMMRFDCDEPKKELFNGVSITITHCIDSSGPDSNGAYEFYYDYETDRKSVV